MTYLRTFFTIDKLSFASVSLSSIELHLEFCHIQKIDPFCNVICVANFKSTLVKMYYALQLFHLYCSLFLSINTSGKLLMCDCFCK